MSLQSVRLSLSLSFTKRQAVRNERWVPMMRMCWSVLCCILHCRAWNEGFPPVPEDFTITWVNICLAKSLIVLYIVGAFNPEKALVVAFYVTVKSSRIFLLAALLHSLSQWEWFAIIQTSLRTRCIQCIAWVLQQQKYNSWNQFNHVSIFSVLK